MSQSNESSNVRSERALIYPSTPIRRRTFSLEDAFYEYAKSIGGGNASKGLRVALAYHADEHAGTKGKK